MKFWYQFTADAGKHPSFAAEHAITLKQRLGLKPSRLRAYTRPTPAALAALGPTWAGI